MHPDRLRSSSRSAQSCRRGAASGFTLIELMITVAIVAILAAIAYPAYTSAVLKGKRAEGRVALTALMQQEERYFTQAGVYLGFNGPSDTSNAVTLKGYSGDNLAKSAYTLAAGSCPTSVSPAAAGLSQCVQIIAVPVRADNLCGALTIISVGLARSYLTGYTVSGTGATTSISGTTHTDASTCWQ